MTSDNNVETPTTPTTTNPNPLGTITIPVKLRIANFVGVILPFIGLIVAIVLLWNIAFNWVHLVILVGMYLATAIGITVGYHRFFTHSSFKTSRPVAAILAILGSMAVEGSVLQWVATHRCHHQNSDGEDDPHSPHDHGDRLRDMIRGMWHAHMGWILSSNRKNIEKYSRDLRRQPLIRWMSRLFPLWVVVGLMIPAALGGLFTMSWSGVLLGFIWGGLVRIFLVHHVTWSINSVCHIWGTKPFNSHDESRNNAIFGVLALGEGWHNNHHAFPTSARHGLRWWQLDVSYIIIWAMSKVGLASDVRIPSRQRIIAKQLAG
ncbi:MAG TPA: acyl-CoA desaturase [Phycisphaerales bacterium]|nr:acyl-CoA desaturase [Phycisphaerales bacterium]